MSALATFQTFPTDIPGGSVTIYCGEDKNNCYKLSVTSISIAAPTIADTIDSTDYPLRTPCYTETRSLEGVPITITPLCLVTSTEPTPASTGTASIETASSKSSAATLSLKNFGVGMLIGSWALLMLAGGL